jgi:hypothetical protein
MTEVHKKHYFSKLEAFMNDTDTLLVDHTSASCSKNICGICGIGRELWTITCIVTTAQPSKAEGILSDYGTDHPFQWTPPPKSLKFERFRGWGPWFFVIWPTTPYIHWTPPPKSLKFERFRGWGPLFLAKIWNILNFSTIPNWKLVLRQTKSLCYLRVLLASHGSRNYFWTF